MPFHFIYIYTVYIVLLTPINLISQQGTLDSFKKKNLNIYANLSSPNSKKTILEVGRSGYRK